METSQHRGRRRQQHGPRSACTAGSRPGPVLRWNSQDARSAAWIRLVWGLLAARYGGPCHQRRARSSLRGRRPWPYEPDLRIRISGPARRRSDIGLLPATLGRRVELGSSRFHGEDGRNDGGRRPLGSNPMASPAEITPARYCIITTEPEARSRTNHDRMGGRAGKG